MPNNYFPQIIGQESVKKQLGFYIDGHRASCVAPSILLVGEKGSGKTMMAKQYGHSLLRTDGTKRPLIEINCSTIKGISQFVNQIYLVHIQDKEVTLLLDEASELPNSLTMALLSLCNPVKTDVNSIIVDGSEIVFDFRKLSLIFATTEGQKMFHALTDRLEKISMESYSEKELLEIIRASFLRNSSTGFISYYQIDEDPGLRLAATLRGNARSAEKMSKKLKMYLDAKNKTHFREHDLTEFIDKLGINALGLNPLEKRILQVLQDCGESSLTFLAASTGLSRESVQRDFELHLMRMGLIKVAATGRSLTTKGIEYLKNAKV